MKLFMVFSQLVLGLGMEWHVCVRQWVVCFW